MLSVTSSCDFVDNLKSPTSDGGATSKTRKGPHAGAATRLSTTLSSSR